MINLALIDDIKKVLRISSSSFDTEITDLIDACKLDLGIAGAVKTSETDKLIKMAITTYCKANFGYDNPDRDKLLESYNMMKNTISLSTNYAYFKVTFTVTDGVDPIGQATIEFDGEIKTTGEAGTATFYALARNNYEYTVSAEGYSSSSGLKDVTTADVSVVVTLS